MGGFDELLRLKGRTTLDRLEMVPFYWNTSTLDLEIATVPVAGVGGGGGPATIADGADITQGAKADLAWDGTALTATRIAIAKYEGAKLEAIRALVAGTLTVALPSGAATSAKQDTGNASLASIDGKLASPLPVTGPLTDAQLRATPVPVSGIVTVVDSVPLAVTQTSQPLPANAAQETGGNLDTLVSRTVLGQAQMTASLPVTLASDQQTAEQRVQRDFAEQAWLRSIDSAALASRGRGAERYSLADRRGRLTRGTVR